MKSSMIVRMSALGWFIAVCVSPALSQEWSVENDHKQTFTIYVSPTNNPNSISTLTLKPGQKGKVALGTDPHVASAVSGGIQYGLEPTDLRGEKTKLSTIWTEKNKRRNGTRVYNYMNQQGFNQDDDFGGRLDSSIWTTTYRTPNGRDITTDLKFAGTSGSYNGGRGRLSDVTYGKDGNMDVISGKWSFDKGRATGTFKFYLKNDNSFTSSRDGNDRSWWGRRAEDP